MQKDNIINLEVDIDLALKKAQLLNSYCDRFIKEIKCKKNQ